MIKGIIGAILLIAAAYILWKNLTIPSSVGLNEGRFSPCPSTPNCVSSEAEIAPFAIAPLPYTSPNSLELIEAYMSSHYQSQTMSKTDNYLHLVITTPLMHFKDDLEFVTDSGMGQVKVRSASRLGYSDLGMNRKRVEELRHYLEMSESDEED